MILEQVRVWSNVLIILCLVMLWNIDFWVLWTFPIRHIIPDLEVDVRIVDGILHAVLPTLSVREDWLILLVVQARTCAQHYITINCDFAWVIFHWSEVNHWVEIVFVIPDIVYLIVQAACKTVCSLICVGQVFELFVYSPDFDLFSWSHGVPPLDQVG